MTSSAERTKEITGKVEDLGEYHAESGRIKADLHLTSIIHTLAVVDSGTDWYRAQFNFYTDPQWQGETEGFSVKIDYILGYLPEIFTRVKKSEKGIENLLSSPTSHSWDINSATDVIRCILSLEDQTQHISKEREVAAKERRTYVRG